MPNESGSDRSEPPPADAAGTPKPEEHRRHGARHERRRAHTEYQKVDAGYLEHRQLRRGAAGWVLLAGLGVSYVISGDFAGWNNGLAEGGWGGLLIAVILMATMYTCMVFGLAELATTMPVAGAGYGFARRALGPLGGFATGTAILIEYAIAPAAIVVFIGGYVESLGLFGVSNSWPVYLVCYVIFVGIHLWGVGEALKILLGITAVAVVALIAFVVGMIPKFSFSNLFDIPVTQAAGANAFIPFGVAGIFAALVYGIWFFLAVEGVPLAAEEAREPTRDMPRGILGAMAVLLVFAALMLLIGPGAAGSAALQSTDNPLPLAVRTAFGGDNWLAQFVNYVGLAGLVASFFSIIYAYSRMLFALSRAGYLPRVLSVTGRRKTPYLALIVPATVGFILAAVTEDGALLIDVAVFGATLSYVLINLSHIVLRVREPELHRPYRTPGGVITTGVALVLAVAALIATFLVDPIAAAITAGIFVVAIAYFLLYSRHHLVASAPEEEFAAVEQAESELSGE